METALSALVGLFFVAAIYLMLSKHIIRMLLGIVLFGNAVNLLIFTAGRVASDVAPIIPEGLAVARRRDRQSAAAGADPDGDRHLVFVLRLPAWCWPIAPTRISAPTTPTACGSPNPRPTARRRWDTDDGGDRPGRGRPCRGNRHDADRAARLACDRAGGRSDPDRGAAADDPPPGAIARGDRYVRACRVGGLRRPAAGAGHVGRTAGHDHGPLAAAVRHLVCRRHARRAVVLHRRPRRPGLRALFAAATSTRSGAATASTRS